MGCKSCERDAIKIYSEISKGTGVNYFYYIMKAAIKL